jgi:hypothetical protein
MRRHHEIFHRRKATTRDAQRKAMEDRAYVEKWFQEWHYFSRAGVRIEGIWNIDETGFQIGYLKNGTFVWTFSQIDNPILTDAHETIPITII